MAEKVEKGGIVENHRKLGKIASLLPNIHIGRLQHVPFVHRDAHALDHLPPMGLCIGGGAVLLLLAQCKGADALLALHGPGAVHGEQVDLDGGVGQLAAGNVEGRLELIL